MSSIRFTPLLRSSQLSWKVLAGIAATGSAAIWFANEQEKKNYFNGNNFNNNNGNNTSKKIGSTLLAGAVIHKANPPMEGSFETYQEVYNDIARKMVNEDDADGGAGRYGILCRLAWHSSGTWSKKDNTGGSYGGTMVFAPESTDPANAGLEYGKAFLLSIKEKYPWISYGDLWTLGGVAAVQEAGGPKIKWRPGRRDAPDDSSIPENGRLPDASQGAKHIRDVFGRLDFNDRETVALIGAHCLGKCHTDRSGFDGPWGPSFNMFTNDFFVRLLQSWHVRKWDGPKQYEDDETNSFMMLPTDYALKEDSGFLKYVKMYAESQDLFFKDFAVAYAALLERGIDFPKSSKPMVFKTLDEQDEE